MRFDTTRERERERERERDVISKRSEQFVKTTKRKTEEKELSMKTLIKRDIFVTPFLQVCLT